VSNLLKSNSVSPHYIQYEDGDEIEIQELQHRKIDDLDQLSQLGDTPVLSGSKQECIPVSIESLLETYKVGLPELTTRLREAAYPSRLPHKRLMSLSGLEEVAVVQDGQYKKVKVAALGGGERINVKEFGAMGDGITDDTYSIQSAIDRVITERNTKWIRVAAPPSGSNQITGSTTQKYPGTAVEIFLPPGEYLITRPLVIAAHCPIRLTGAGPDYTILKFDLNYTSYSSAPTLTLTSSPIIFTLDKKWEKESLYNYGNGVIGMTIKCIYTSIPRQMAQKSALHLNRQAEFFAQDLRLENGICSLEIKDCIDCHFENMNIRSKSFIGENTSALWLWNSTGQVFDNVVFEGQGDGVQMAGGSAFFHACCFSKNARHGMFLFHWQSHPVPPSFVGIFPFVSISQCRFEKNQKSAILQYPPDLKLTMGNSPATIILTDSALYPSDEGGYSLIDVNYCDLDVRDSPSVSEKAGAASSPDYYLRLPEYGSGSFDAEKVSANIENHQIMTGPSKIHDPSGVVTGTVRRFRDELTGSILSEVNQYMDMQSSRALRVEKAEEDNLVDPSINKNPNYWAFSVALEEGGSKTINLHFLYLRNGFNPKHHLCTIRFRTPRPITNTTLRPVGGQELDLLLVNEKWTGAKEPIKFELPENFLYDSDRMVSPVLSIVPEDTRLLSFIYLDNLLVLRTSTFSGKLPAIGTEVEIRVVVAPKINWDAAVASGHILRTETRGTNDTLFYLEVENGGAVLDRFNLALMWFLFPKYQINQHYKHLELYKMSLVLQDKGGLELVKYSGPSDPSSTTLKMPTLSGCWIQTR
jgi:hypothetical protein